MLTPVHYAAFAAGFVLAAALTGAGGWAYDEWIDDPAVYREATAKADAACAIRTMDAANRAQQAERARQRAASAEARRIYDEALNANQRAREAAETQLEQEIADYEAQSTAEGRSCLLTGIDLLWLHQRGPAGAD